MMEDEDTADTLKSAHLAEWIQRNGGDSARHHHHDPYHIDGQGNETEYARPGGGYTGAGFDHNGKDDLSGLYGNSNPNYKTSQEFLEKKPSGPIWGLYEGGATGGDMPSEVRPWWNKLEKNQFNGMSSRKEYDQVAQDIIEKNKDIDVAKISKAVLRREYEY